jgi:hypothetical protein
MITFKDFKARRELPLREKFMRGDVLRIGQLVEDDSGVFQILDRGTNYVTCSDSSGTLVKKFISEVKSIPMQAPVDTLSCFKGYQSKIEDPIAEACFTTLIDKYTDGTIVDSVAILKALKAYNENNIAALKVSLSRLHELDNHIYLKESMDNLKTNDKLKVASVIADAINAACNYKL